MVFLVFMTICIGALFFMPDLRDNYLSNYVVVWSPPTATTGKGFDNELPINKEPDQLPRPSEVEGEIAFLSPFLNP